MPKGIYLKTKEHRENIGKSYVKTPAREKHIKELIDGYVLTPKRLEHIKKMAFAHRGHCDYSTIESRKKISEANKGHKSYNTKESNEKISKTLKEKHKLGLIKLPIRFGSNTSNWKGGISKKEGYNSYMSRRRQIRKKLNGGFHTLGEWENLKAQYNWTCPCCGRKEPEIKLTEDHIVSIKNGGSDNIENIQPLCKSCNCKKHTKTKKY